jgi:hypothetical protein
MKIIPQFSCRFAPDRLRARRVADFSALLNQAVRRASRPHRRLRLGSHFLSLRSRPIEGLKRNLLRGRDKGPVPTAKGSVLVFASSQ